MGNAQVVALLLLRVVVGLTMIAHGTNHWKGGGRIEGTARWFSGLGHARDVLAAAAEEGRGDRRARRAGARLEPQRPCAHAASAGELVTQAARSG